MTLTTKFELPSAMIAIDQADPENRIRVPCPPTAVQIEITDSATWMTYRGKTWKLTDEQYQELRRIESERAHFFMYFLGD